MVSDLNALYFQIQVILNVQQIIQSDNGNEKSDLQLSFAVNNHFSIPAVT